MCTGFKCISPKYEQCVPLIKVCDGIYDCEDRSDEDIGCHIKHSIQVRKHGQTPCSTKHMFLCNDGSNCIPKRFYCDGVVHCSDHSDEPSPCWKAGAPKNRPADPKVPMPILQLPYQGAKVRYCDKWKDFRCENIVQCIPRRYLCDGIHNCIDKTDEKVACAHVPRKCRLHHKWICTNQMECIHINSLCDGIADCTDESDENVIMCAYQLELRNRCPWPTDGNMCRTPVLEHRHEPLHVCYHQPGEFRCHDESGCVPTYFACDTIKHCPDGSDETTSICEYGGIFDTMGATYPKRRCPQITDFMCLNRQQCVPRKWLCDGTKECDDGSDEREGCWFIWHLPDVGYNAKEFHTPKELQRDFHKISHVFLDLHMHRLRPPHEIHRVHRHHHRRHHRHHHHHHYQDE
ncbi:hypothetical protein SNEBB_008693 [Seison nebaliae]|nr:hypothetical protein SNEBB_008693 [Seison nebaliae]